MAIISFDKFMPTDGLPIYAQILLYLKRGAAAGTIRDGDELPSRRYLSTLLGVNPNTVQKAYHLLEEEGLIRSYAGSKSVMVLSEEATGRIRRQLVARELRQTADNLRQMGLSCQEALALLEQYWEGGNCP